MKTKPGRLLRGFTRLPDISWVLVYRVFWRNLLVFKKTWKANLMFNFFEPVLYLWAMGFGLGTYVTRIKGLSYLDFLAPALICSSAMFATTYEMTYGSFSRMGYQKTFQGMVATPVSMDDVILGEILYGTFKGILYGSVFFLVVFLFGVVRSPWALLIPLPLGLMVMVFSIISLIWTSFTPNFDYFGYFFTLFISPMFLFAGVFFPIENLPAGIRFLPWFTPLYHAVEVVRAFVLGQVTTAVLPHLAWLAASVIVTIQFSLVMVRNRLIQ